MSKLFFLMSGRFLVMLALLFVQACSYLPNTTTHRPDGWAQTVAQKQQLKQWKLTARLGMQTEKNGGSLDVFWKQEDDEYKIRLIAAMGQGTILIQGNKHQVMLRTNEGISYADDADQLLADSLGVNVPINGLNDWLRGLPSETNPVQKQLWNEQGQLYKLEQDGWDIEMSDYKKVGDYVLPHAFYLERDDQPELEMRLLIRQWTLMDDDNLHGSVQ